MGLVACCLRQGLTFASDSACLVLDDAETSVTARDCAGTSAVETFVAEGAVVLDAVADVAVGYSTSKKKKKEISTAGNRKKKGAFTCAIIIFCTCCCSGKPKKPGTIFVMYCKNG